MNLLYICEPGIKLWEQPAHTSAPGFTTISILNKSISDIWATWQELAKTLIIDWPTAVKWRTIGHSLEQHKVQELLLRKEICKDLTSNDIIKKNENTKIYSYARHINPGDALLNPNELTQYRNTLLLLIKSAPNLDEIWKKLSIADKGVTSDNIFSFLCSQRETVIGRLIENDIYSAAQIICSIKYSSNIETLLNNMNFQKISASEIPKAIKNL